MLWVQEVSDGVIFKITVQARASRNRIVGLQGDALKVKLTAPPVEGAANRLCVEFLAKSLGVRKSDVEIIQGERSRAKKLLVRSASRDSVESLLKIR